MQDKYLICNNCNHKNTKFINSYPYNTNFNNENYFFYCCTLCSSTSIYPKLNIKDINLLYTKLNYHEEFYSYENSTQNEISIYYIKKFLKKNAYILDYGCGNANLIKNLSGFSNNLFGVDTFDLDNKNYILDNSIKYYDYQNFYKNNKNKFDLIILRDVLEHVNEPITLLNNLIKCLKNNGIIYIEGPLEKNFSLINFCIHFYAFIKNTFYTNNKNEFKPYHLFYNNFKSQKFYFKSFKNLSTIYSKIYETGWPYEGAGLIKDIISKISKLIYLFINNSFINTNYGNRFIIVLRNEI